MPDNWLNQQSLAGKLSHASMSILFWSGLSTFGDTMQYFFILGKLTTI